jgi:hypothetical protein
MVDTQPATPGACPVTLPAETGLANAGGIGKQVAAAVTPGVGAVIAGMTAMFRGPAGIRLPALACQQARGNGTELRLPASLPYTARSSASRPAILCDLGGA